MKPKHLDGSLVLACSIYHKLLQLSGIKSDVGQTKNLSQNCFAKCLFVNGTTASSFICVVLKPSICASFGAGKSKHIKKGLDRTKVLHHTRNIFPPGPSQWTKKLLKCIFLIEGADILHTAIDFQFCFFILLFSKNRFKQECVLEACETIYSTLYTVKPSIQDMEQLLFSSYSRLSHLQDSHTCIHFPLLFVILVHKCAVNHIPSYNKCIHTPCNIS